MNRRQSSEYIGRLGDIEIQDVIGHGGMGVVLKGYQPELKRLVAVKVLAPQLAVSAAARKRFAREVQATAAILHPNVMPILTVHSSGKLPFIVMPYVACESLQQRLDRVGSLELIDILRIGMQTANGLAAAHAQGLVHRDVKPANILLEISVEKVMLTDFGLARAIDDASITRTGIIAGTPLYMSPEQARGEPWMLAATCLVWGPCSTHWPPDEHRSEPNRRMEFCADSPMSRLVRCVKFRRSSRHGLR